MQARQGRAQRKQPSSSSELTPDTRLLGPTEIDRMVNAPFKSDPDNKLAPGVEDELNARCRADSAELDVAEPRRNDRDE